MKNLLFIAVLALFSFTASAQSNVGNLLSVHGLPTDTVTNTGVESLTLAITGAQESVTVLTTITEISGTTAGTARLWGSIDGTIYALVDGAGTFSPADVAGPQSYAWQVKPSAFTHYRVIYTGVGTMAAQIKAKALWRK